METAQGFTARQSATSNLRTFQLPPPDHLSSMHKYPAAYVSSSDLLSAATGLSSDRLSPLSSVNSGSSGSTGYWPTPSYTYSSVSAMPPTFAQQQQQQQQQPYMGRPMYSPSMNFPNRNTNSGKNEAWEHMRNRRNAPGGMRPNASKNFGHGPGGITLGSYRIGKAPQLLRPCSTISIDNTAGDRARKAVLLAEFGQKNKRPGGATTLPMITLAPEQADMRLRDYSNILHPRQEITGPADQDRTQASPTTELLTHAHQAAEYNKQINSQRARSNEYLDRHWRQPHEAPSSNIAP